MIVADLLRQAYFTAHVIGEGEEADGFLATDGLQIFNQILDDWGSLGVYIPYHTYTTIELVANTPSYVVTPVIAELDEAQLIVSTNLKFSLLMADTKQFSNFNFAFPITRPTSIYIGTQQTFDDNGLLASTVYFWPTPDQAYTAQLIQKQTLANVTLFDDLSMLPPRMYKTLRYQLASDFQIQYGTELPERFYRDLDMLIAKMHANNPSDNAVQTRDIFHTQRRFNPWGYGPRSGGYI